MSPSLRVAACGAVGGAANAFLCYARLPVPAASNSTFAWHIIPAGAIHGGVLAAIAFRPASLLAQSSLSRRLLMAVPLAWIAGFASWIPLNLSAFNEGWAKSLTWPFHEHLAMAVFAPFQYFGFVAGLYYLLLARRGAREQSAAMHVFCACASGVLGSLWWWSAMEPWYFSPIHGLLWGTAVGLGAARSRVVAQPEHD